MAEKRVRRKRKNKIERYDEVLAAAAKVFSEVGYRGATIHKIAAELDMTGAALYHYVDSKEALLIEICTRAGNRLEATARAVAALDLPAEERLRHIFRRHLELLIEDRPAFAIMINERSEVPREWISEFVEGERSYIATIRALLEEIQSETPDGPDVRIAALSMMGSLNWVLRWYREDGAYTLPGIADELYTTFMHGFLHREGPEGRVAVEAATDAA